MPSHSVISLDLSHNNITELGDKILPTNIIHLKISHNKIEELTSEDIHYLESLTTQNNFVRITLGNNPYKCDCTSEHFLNYLVYHQRYLEDYHNISLTCSDQPLPLHKAH